MQPTTTVPPQQPGGPGVPGAARESRRYYDENGRFRTSREPVPVDQYGRIVGAKYGCRRCRTSRWYPAGLKGIPACERCDRRMTQGSLQSPPLLPWRELWDVCERPLRPVWALPALAAAGYAVDAAPVPMLVLVGAAPVAGELARRVAQAQMVRAKVARGRLEDDDPEGGKRLRAAIARDARHVGYTAAGAVGWLSLVTALGIDPSTVVGRVALVAAGLAVWLPPAATWWRKLRLERNRRDPDPVPEPEVAVDGPPPMDPDEAQTRRIWATTVGARQVTEKAATGPVVTRRGGKLAGTWLEDWHRVEGGWGATIASTPGVYTSESFLAARSAIASAFRMKVGMITIIPDAEDESQALVLAQRTSPIRDTVRWAGPASIDAARGRAPVALYADGNPVLYELYRPGWGVPHVAAFGTTGSGKALALDTPIPTPNGWTTMGALRVGDQVFDESGQPCNVVAATEVMRDHDCYEVEFSDGTVIVADAEHLWKTTTQHGRWQRGNLNRGKKPRPDKRVMLDVEPVTTRQIAATLFAERGGNQPAAVNHAVEVCGPLEYPKRDLPVAPYTLGAWLGDGRTDYASITCADGEILEQIRLDGYKLTKQSQPLAYGITNRIEYERRIAVATVLVREGLAVNRAAKHVGISPPPIARAVRAEGIGLKRLWAVQHRPSGPAFEPFQSLPSLLRQIGVLGNKHIPEQYLRASIDQRRALLAGLLDTDGTCGMNGVVSFAVTNERLARDTLDLVLGLGYKATMRTRPVNGRSEATSTCYMVAFTAHEPVFRLTRKNARQRIVSDNSPSRRRYIVDARPVPSVPVRCIGVDSPSRLYLASKACIPTHNSEFLNGLFAIDRWAHHTGEDGVRRGLVADFLIDPQQGQSFAPFLDDLAAPVACSLPEAMLLIEALHAEMLRRNRYLAREAKTWDERRKKWRTGRKWWNPLVDGPILALTIDEAHDYLSHKPFATLVTKAGRMWRKCGGQVRIATHTPLLSDLGGSMALRDMLTGGFVWVGRTANRLSGPTAFNGRLPVDPCTIPPVPGTAYILTGLEPRAMLARTAWEPDYYDWVRDGDDNPIGYPAAVPPVTLAAFGPEYGRWVSAQGSDELWVPGSSAASAQPEVPATAVTAVRSVLLAAMKPLDMNELDEALRLAGTPFATRTVREALKQLRDVGEVHSGDGRHQVSESLREQAAELAEASS